MTVRGLMGLQAALFGLLGGSTLVLGALIGLYVKVKRRTIAVVTAFGAGVLIATLSFELVAKAYVKGGFDSTTTGFVVGAALFIIGDWAVNTRGGHLRSHALTKRYHAYNPDHKDEGSGLAIFIGALLDGIPESAAIGISLIAGEGIGWAVLAAVFISNLPEGVSGAVSMTNSGWKKASTIAMWASIAVMSSLSSLAGYLVLGHMGVDGYAFITALAGGAILAMVSSTMIPEAFDYEGRITPIATPIATVAGFLLSFVLSELAR